MRIPGFTLKCPGKPSKDVRAVMNNLCFKKNIPFSSVAEMNGGGTEGTGAENRGWERRILRHPHEMVWPGPGWQRRL